jgi:N-carbamoylputrescine amidase
MTASEKTKIALVQMQCGTDPAANMEKAIARIRDAAKEGAQIICLPELFRSQYFCQSEDHANFALAEEIPGPTTAELEKVARETGAVIVASLFEKRAAGVYHNTAAITGFRRGRRPTEKSASAFAGTNGIPSPLA